MKQGEILKDLVNLMAGSSRYRLQQQSFSFMLSMTWYIYLKAHDYRRNA